MTTSPATDQKSRQIIDAARKVLAEKGFAGTTVNLVAAEAGVSRGLLHYHFKNKEAILAQVIRENMRASEALVADMLADAPSPEAFAARLIGGLRTLLREDPAFFHLFFEAWAVARQSPLVADELAALYGRFRRAIQDGLQDAMAADRLRPALPSQGMALLLTAIVDGLGMQLITEPGLLENEALWLSTTQAVASLLGAR